MRRPTLFAGLLCVLTIVDALQLRAPVRPLPQPAKEGLDPLPQPANERMRVLPQPANTRVRPLPQPAHGRNWSSWVNEIAVHGIEAVLRSDDADEYVSMLQQRPEWHNVSKLVALCYQAGATHVLVYGSSVGGKGCVPGWIELLVQFCPEEYRERMESTCSLGFVICRHEELQDELRAVTGMRVRICPLSLNVLAMAEHNKKFWSGCSYLPGGGWEGIILPETLWISRCGAVRPAKSFANLIYEIAACEEASATR